MRYLFILSIIFALFYLILALPCVLKNFPNGFVCVCNETYCDTLEDDKPDNANSFLLITSSRGGHRFKVTRGAFTHGLILNQVTIKEKYKVKQHMPNEKHNEIEPSLPTDFDNENTTFSFDNNGQIYPTVILYNNKQRNKRFIPFLFNKPGVRVATIKVDRGKTYQRISGFGGAFTGAVSYNLNLLPIAVQHQVYRSFYSLSEGIHYTMLRYTIGGCDFDLGPWAYNEYPENDAKLSNFSKLDDRDIFRMGQIKELKSVSNNYDIKIMGAAWSPPRWMKTNNDWTGAAVLKHEYYQTWADYHLRYLELMDKENVTFWALSTANEPLNGLISWMFVHFMSIGMTAEQQGHWVGNNFGPTIKNSKFKDVKLFAGDDQRYILPWWLDQMNDANAMSLNYIDGVAVHWYMDSVTPVSFLDNTHKKYPNHMIINTESCVGSQPFEVHKPVLGSWPRAQEYVLRIMEDLQHWVTGWIDWNLILDPEGGPNYVNNSVDAPIVANFTEKVIYKQPIFYALGHFSRFLLPDSIRIDTTSSIDEVLVVGFERPDRSIALVIYNSLNEKVDLKVIDGRRTLIINVPPYSLHTLIYY